MTLTRVFAGGRRPRVWYDHSVTTWVRNGGGPASNGGLVDEILDRSGNGFHCTQPVMANQPTWNSNQQNGLGTIDYSGGKFFNTVQGSNVLTSTTKLSVFAVASFNVVNARQVIIEIASGIENEGMNLFQNAGGGGINMFYRSGDTVGAGVTAGANYPHSTTSTYELHTGITTTVNDREIFLAGVLQDPESIGRADLGPHDQISVGTHNSNVNFLNGDIGEIIVFEFTMTASQQASRNGSLISKWAV